MILVQLADGAIGSVFRPTTTPTTPQCLDPILHDLPIRRLETEMLIVLNQLVDLRVLQLQLGKQPLLPLAVTGLRWDKDLILRRTEYLLLI